MSLPQILRTNVAPQELELIASQQIVDIIPSIKLDRTAFIDGVYGPFNPPRSSKIPLWMAVNLKLKKKCRIIAPEWLNVAYFQDKLAEEKELIGFAELPWHIAEMSKVLLDVASDDLAEPDKIRTLLQDLREIRQAKARQRLQQMNYSHLQMNHLTSMEINEIRPYFAEAMSIFGKLEKPDEEEPV